MVHRRPLTARLAGHRTQRSTVNGEQSTDTSYTPPVAEDLPKPLRDDVRLLGELLGETLRRQENHALYETVERVRAMAKSARGGNQADFDALTGILERMTIDEALPVARAFSHFLTLANIAEQHHRIRRRRRSARATKRWDVSAAPAFRPTRSTTLSWGCRSSWSSRRTRLRSRAGR